MPSADGLAAWLRLTLIPGVGRETQRKLLAAFGLPDQIFAASATAWRAAANDRVADLLGRADCDAAVAAGLEWASAQGNRIITLADPDYPRPLLETADPPTLLYVKGRADLLNRPALAIVGSRNASPQGERDAASFAATLAEGGLTIVSGLALGIDAAAHRGALATPAGTVAVIGTGPDRIYPARNRELALAIAERGAIVSEFPLGTPAVAGNFPRRNRIIAGLALGVLVVEAAPESGSLITARLAGEAGREVFAIPGSIHSPLARGCHRLIKQGAKLVESAADILEDIGWRPVEATPAAEGTGDRQASSVLEAVGFDPFTLDPLCERTGLTPEHLSGILLHLELDGKIAALPGGRYQRLA